MTARAPVAGKRPFRMIAGVSTLSDLADGAGAGWGYPGSGYSGKQYFVNNITGSSSASGESWDDPFDEITTAITASETWRQLKSGTTNDYIRNQIFVQGTGTGYAQLTVLPSHCDVIGVGALPFGNGAGIPLIGLVSGGTATAVDTGTATVRGCEFYNMQFAFGSGATNGVQLDGAFLRGGFFNCSFLNSGTASTGSCLAINNSFAGNVIRGCQFSGDSGYPAYGINFANSIAMNNNIIEDNLIIGGTTAAVIIGANVNDVNTVFRNNLIGASQANNSTKAFDDNGPGYCWVVNNVIVGADAIETSNNNFIGNYTMDGTTAGFEKDISNF